jgi:hypothetical protein
MMFTFSLFVCWQLGVCLASWKHQQIQQVTSLTWDRGQFFMHSALQLTVRLSVTHLFIMFTASLCLCQTRH